jgi:hypothetical protein
MKKADSSVATSETDRLVGLKPADLNDEEKQSVIA